MPAVRLPLSERFVDDDGTEYRCSVEGTRRGDGTLEVHLFFRAFDQTRGRSAAHPYAVQRDEESMVSWARSLSRADLERAFHRAVGGASILEDPMQHSEWIMDKLAAAGTVEMNALFEAAPFSSTEVVRAVNDLERQRLAARFSWDGRDWVSRVQPKAPGERRRGRIAAEPALVQILNDPVERSGRSWQVLILGAPRADGTWAGWLEFRDAEECARTSEETSQPSFEALSYWASGLERVYVEGAMERAFGKC